MTLKAPGRILGLILLCAVIITIDQTASADTGQPLVIKGGLLIDGTGLLDNLGRVAKSGGKVALGTDYGGGPFAMESGMPIKEIPWMHEAVMSPSKG